MSFWSQGRIALLTFCVLLVGTEAAVRLLLGNDSTWNMRLGHMKRFDPYTRFRLKSNYEILPGIKTNEQGYLAPPDLGFERPSDAVRIIFLGDSASVQPVIGSYPSQVEALLAERGLRVQTLNAAVPGFDSGKARTLFSREIQHYDADFFFVYLGWNDLGQYGPEGLPYKRDEQGYEVTVAQKVFSEIYTARFLLALQQFVLRRQPTVDEPLSAEEERLYDAYYPAHFEENLRAILELGKQRYPKVVIMNLATITSTHPTAWELQTAHFPTGMNKNLRKLHKLVLIYNDVVEKVAREQGVERIDLFRVFDSEQARREFTDTSHMNQDGTRRMAETAAAVVLRERGQLARGPGAP